MRHQASIRPALLLALAALWLGACSVPALTRNAGPSGGRQILATALAAADRHGVAFSMTEQIQVTGGSVPAGRVEEVDAVAHSGLLRGGIARFDYAFTSGSKSAYQAVVDGPKLYLKKGGGPWQSIAYVEAIRFMPTVSLNLMRQLILLSPAVPDPSLGWGQDGPARSATAPAAVEQVAQLLGYTGELTGLDQAASAAVTVDLGFPADDLKAVTVHVTLKDPSSGATIVVNSTLTTRSARVGTINLPSSATPITIDQLFQ
ncbi:MAG: hypothetical protein M3024_13875 [Candidatus Dormibacteraeota bacterium]|nr:hypothetical protein [Candidatus Dormibacteraeota bacterium]